MKIYVASSWRNTHQQDVVRFLRNLGHEVYDFRNPAPGNTGFHWGEIDPEWQQWDAQRFRLGLEHPISDRGFDCDMQALRGCDACVLVLPCGRSAHLELGWAAGAGKQTVVYLADDNEPELMYKMASAIALSLPEVERALVSDSPQPSSPPPRTSEPAIAPIVEANTQNKHFRTARTLPCPAEKGDSGPPRTVSTGATTEVMR